MTIKEAEKLVETLGADAAEKVLKSATVTDDDGNTVEFKIKKQEAAPASIDTAEIVKQVTKAVRDEIKAGKPPISGEADIDIHHKRTVPAQAKRWSGNLKAFKGSDAEYNAYGLGLWAVSQFSKNAASVQKANKWLAKEGIVDKALNETVNAQGGDLVPDQFVPQLIRLVEEYGVFRRNARVQPMSGETAWMPRRTGGVTAYFVGESTTDAGTTATKSTPSSTKKQLVAQKLATYTLESIELMEDAAISVGDWLAQEIALAFAQKEDECGFNGDGTSTYGGINGILNFVGSASLVTAVTGNTAFSTLDLDDFEACVGKLPRYAISGAKWYISSFGWATSMLRLAQAAGGNTTTNIEGGTGLSFLGYPVEITQVLNATSGAQASAKVAVFGNLAQGCIFGDRRQPTIQTDVSRHFDTDQVAIKGTERFDIGCHTFDSTSTAGPVIVLKLAAS